MDERHSEFLKMALHEAEKSLAEGGGPMGAVIVHQGQVIGRGRSQQVQKNSTILHAEMDALENTGRQAATVYRHSTLYTTLSPCSMCSGAMLLYGIPRVVVGDNQNYMGEEAWLRSRGVEVVEMNDDACIEILRKYIDEDPSRWAGE